MNFELVAPASLRLRSGQARRLSGRHFAFPLIALSLALQASTVSIARTKHSPPSPAPDPGYASALAAANRFLQAWQNQDHEAGLLMLTDVAKQHSSEDRLEIFFSFSLTALSRWRTRQAVTLALKVCGKAFGPILISLLSLSSKPSLVTFTSLPIRRS